MSPRACILGCRGGVLAPDERSLFRDADPWAFILFARNIEGPEQTRALTRALRDAVGRDAMVFIDQEGGRVQRLKPPTWRAAPPAEPFGRLYAKDPETALEAVRLNHRLLAHELIAVGVDADCAPVLDLAHPGADAVIGDRSFGADPEMVASLGRAALEGLQLGGVVGVVKHVPGHGRADADSHLKLPRVEASREALEASDFRPFLLLNDAPMAMTAHVVYTDVDPKSPATMSPTVIGRVIRGYMGFEGLLMTDDLSMKALDGGFDRRAADAIAAGCDIALHCNGARDEMEGVVAGAPRLAGMSLARAERAEARRRPPDGADADALLAKLDGLMSAVA